MAAKKTAEQLAADKAAKDKAAADKAAANKAARDKAAADKAAADRTKATQAEEKSRTNAINAVSKAVQGVADPSRFITATTKNGVTTYSPEIFRAESAFITENLRLDPNVFKSGTKGDFDLPLAKLAVTARDAGLDYTNADLKKAKYAPATITKLGEYKSLGLTNPERFIGKDAEAEAAVIREVYKLDPASYAGTTRVQIGTTTDPRTGRQVPVNKTFAKYNLEGARQQYQADLPKLTFSESTSLEQAIGNFKTAVTAVKSAGVKSLNQADTDTIRLLAEEIYDFGRDSQDASVREVVQATRDAMTRLDSISDLNTTVRNIRTKAGPKGNFPGITGETKKRYQDQLFQAENDLEIAFTRADREITPLLGVLGRVNPLATVPGLSAEEIGAILGPTTGGGTTGGGTTGGGTTGGGTTTSPGTTYTAPSGTITSSDLSALAANITDPPPATTTASLINAGTLNSNITDEELQAIINKEATYKIDKQISDQNAIIATINSDIAAVDAALAKINSTNPNYNALVKRKTDLTKDLGNATTILNNATEIKSGTKPNTYQVDVQAIRDQLRLADERALDQINEIDPKVLQTANLLQDNYLSMLRSPVGPTQDDRTEELRGIIEDEALNQLRLGSTLDESVRREVQQAARGAQTARGNIFGVAPAVEEAMQTGLMGEQRKAQRYGAAASFLGSGMTRGDQAARNTSLRQALNLNRLGAANAFVAEGANPYNLARDRVSQQDARALNYINANAAAAGGFANTAQTAEPFRYVNPNAGISLAQNATNIYGGLLDFTSNNYRSQAGALAQVASANSIPNYISAFSSLVPSLSF